MSILAAARHPTCKRWAIGAALALGLHAAAVAAFAVRSHTSDGDDGRIGFEVELGLVAAEPNTARDDLAPGPLQEPQDAPPPAPPKPESAREEKTRIENAPDGEIAVPTPPQEQPPTPEAPPPATAPPRQQRATAAQVSSWNRQIEQRIVRNKGYPAAARARRETGTVEIAFGIDHQGMIAMSRIIRSSGSDALDKEALDTLQRAQPFPSPPAGIDNKQLEFTLPLRFNIVDAKTPKR